MECNKEEAVRAKTLAETKMLNNDFVGAQKLVMKAQRLFPGLENLPQMLAVCDVHIAVEKKINGLENWYGIIQVMHFEDDATIKKQYRKLALLLHPDKNQFTGAEAAFKLVTEASRLLSDKEKRSQYDIKHRIYSRIANRQLNANSSQQCAAANNASDSIINNATFWTFCEHCRYRYKYKKEHVNSLLKCFNCQRSYKAYDTGANGFPTKSSTDNKEVQNQEPSNTSLHNNVESNGAQSGNTAVEVDKIGTVKEKLDKKNGESEFKRAKVRKPNMEDGHMKNCAGLSKPEKGLGKMKNISELLETEVLKPKRAVTEPETSASKSLPAKSVSKTDQVPSMSKNKRKIVEEPIESVKVDVSDIFEDKEYSKDNNKRRSSRKIQQRSSDDFISPPRSRSRSSVGLKSERATKKQNLGVGSSKRLDSRSTTSAPSCVTKGKAKKNVDYDKKTKKCEASGERVVMAENEKPLTQDLPDPDFNNFELTTSSFAVNQVWSLYDLTDGMPRFYARIDKILDSEFKLRITWIDPVQDGKDNSIPIACGIFQDGDSEEVDDHLIFSCQMFHYLHKNNIIIYPRKGEIWGVFRGWNASSGKQKRPYEYDYVEILSDFKDEDGLGVAYLGKVEGFISLFRHEAQQGVFQFQISPNEMLRFSHKVPSVKMTGKEREGVPPGCFELDTAALSKDLFEVDNLAIDGESRDDKTRDPFHEASKVGVQANTTLEISPSPKKSQKVHDNHGTRSSKKRGDSSLSESRGNGSLTPLNSATKTSKPETCVPSSCTTKQKHTFNFESQRSCDKFKLIKYGLFTAMDFPENMCRSKESTQSLNSSYT